MKTLVADEHIFMLRKRRGHRKRRRQTRRSVLTCSMSLGDWSPDCSTLLAVMRG